MNLLLTGGTGYIGAHTAVVLAQAGYNTVLYDNLLNSSAVVVDRVETITGTRPILVEGDIRDTVRLAQTLQDHKIDAVLHFAGLKAVGESVEKPIDYYANNVQGTISLLQAMRISNVKTLVFSSSATVYGDPQTLPIDEEHPTAPSNPYGRTKRIIEDMLADMSASDKTWRIACLRYFNPVGAHESSLIGENPRGIPNNLMPYIAQVAAGIRPHLNVFGNDYLTPDGSGVRDYIHVMDLAEGHRGALDFLRTQPGWHVFNLGTGTGHSVFEMVRALEIASGQTIPCKIGPRRPGDVATCFASTDKAETTFGWKASRGIDDMCASTWKFQERNSPL